MRKIFFILTLMTAFGLTLQAKPDKNFYVFQCCS